MKKIFTLIMFAALTASSAMAQENLLKNPQFGDLNDKGVPNGWLLYDNEVLTVVDGSVADFSGVKFTGKSTLKQYVNDVVALNDVFTVSFDYKLSGVQEGDKYTARFYGNWQNADRKMVPPSDEDKEKMQSSTPYEASAEWKHVSFTITAHDETIKNIEYGLRSYSNVTVEWSNPVLVKGEITGLTDANATKTGIYAYDGTVVVLANESGVAEVYNLLGEKVKSVMVEEGSNEISDLAHGQVYVVRYGNKVQKVIL